MVEGPGCKQNGEKLRSKVLGQAVKSVCGTVTNNSSSTFITIIGLKIIDIKSLGKELFIYFDKDICLKIHFMFNGCFRFESDNRCDLKNEEPMIKVNLTRESFNFYYGKVHLASRRECEKKYKELIDFDICSPSFNAEKVQKVIRKQPNRLICDVLLDQHILPGVGNVIKNEALFNASINPSTHVKELSHEVIAHCVLKTREFTMYFSKLRQTGSWQKETKGSIHGRNECKNCCGRIRVCKLGEYKRLTYFCPHCQNNSPVTKTTSIAQETPSSSSSLLNTQNKVKGMPDQSISKWFKPLVNIVSWSCKHCTLINNSANDKCNVCLQTREIAEDESKDITLENVENTSQGISNLKMSLGKRKSTEENTLTGYKFKKLNHLQGLTDLPKKTNAEIPKSEYNTKSTNLVHLTQSVVCSDHKKNAKKSQVSKNNENKGRPFFTCSQPQKCNFFKWGDDHHPKCLCGKITIQRQCYKNNANNGRYFYCCSNPKQSQCSVFQWVE